MSDLECDVAVVGAGAAGACVAYALAKSGVQTLLIDKGKWHDDVELDDDELHYYILRKGWPELADEHTVVDVGLWDQSPKIHRMGQSYGYVGGGTIFYAGVSERFRDADFNKHSLYGSVPGASIIDWPHDFYRELEPYYCKAERLIGIAGDTTADPLDPFRSVNELQRPLPRHQLNDQLYFAAQKLGWHPFSIPLALNSEFRDPPQMNWCVSSGLCSGFPCAWKAKNSVDEVLLKPLAALPSLRVLSNTVARRLEARGDHCTGVVISNRADDVERRVSCKAAVLCASGILTPHLLLMSSSKDHPNGLGNSNGLVGRYATFHIEDKKGAIFEGSYPRENFYNVKKLQVNDHYLPDAKTVGYINHLSIQSGSKSGPIRYALAKQPAGWGKQYLEQIAYEFSRYYELQAMVEDLPQESNFVSIDSASVDIDGLPRAKLFHRYHEMDGLALLKAHEFMETWLQAAGAQEIGKPSKLLVDWKSALLGGGKKVPPPWRPVGYHLLGTTRMGDDPDQSVVNRDCRMHEVRNVFIADGSIFPTSAGVNPTLTIQANAFRVADRIIQLSTSGEL